MKSFILGSLIGCVFFLLLGGMSVEGETVIVAKDGSGDYETIQEAVENATEWDWIRVEEGEYYETITITERIILIGNGSHDTKIIGDGSGDVVAIRSNNVVFNDFMVSNGINGISVYADNVTLMDNYCVNNNEAGIYAENGTNNTIRNNRCDNNVNGIVLRKCNDTFLYRNNVSHNDDNGIVIVESNENLVIENHVMSNKNGIMIGDGNDNYLENNYCSDGYVGIHIKNSSTTTIIRNTIENNYEGIYLENSTFNGFGQCIIAFNDYGIVQDDDSSDNQAYNNIIHQNSEYGIINENDETQFNASFNWWGDVTGPYHPGTNPEGKGDEVSDYILFHSWITNDPYVHYVDDDALPGGNGSEQSPYRTIQEAVGLAADGDTILVKNGTYFESITVDVRVDIIGEGNGTTVIEAEGFSYGFQIITDWVNISGFEIRNASWGISIGQVNHTAISHIVLENNTNGIRIFYSMDIRISNTECFNGTNGIFSENSDKLMLSEIHSSMNSLGIYVIRSTNITMENGQTTNNTRHGIQMVNCGYISAVNWNASDNGYNGIDFREVWQGSIQGSVITGNDGYGIEFRESSWVSVTECTLDANGEDGIRLWGYKTSNITIEDNEFNWNEKAAVTLNGQDIVLRSNAMMGSGLFIGEGTLKDPAFSLDIGNTNTVNGKKILTFMHASSQVIDFEVGQLILVNCIDMTIRDLTLGNVSVGITITQSMRIDILRTNLWNNSVYGIFIVSSESCTIQEVICNGSGEAGIYIADSQFCTIREVTCEGSEDYGIRLIDVANSTIENSVCSYNWWGLSSSNSEGLTIQKVECRGNEDDGMSLSGTEFMVRECDFIENNGSGLHLYGDHFAVELGNVSGNRQHGIDSNYLSESRISSCVSTKNGYSGIRVYGSHNIIKYNVCIENAHNGIYMESAGGPNYHRNNTLENNSCWDNGWSGISVMENRMNILRNNNCLNNNHNGISLYNTRDNHLESNILSGNTEDGLHLAYHCYNNTVIDTSFTGNGWVGINISRSSATYVFDSLISDNFYGISIQEDASTATITGCVISHNVVGVQVSGPYSAITINHSIVLGNEVRGIRVNEPDGSDVSAEDCWWGSDTGPYHVTDNPMGDGESVSDYVDYVPWLMVPPDHFRPEAWITEAAPNQTVKGTSISFNGAYRAYGSPLSSEWTSSLDGVLRNGLPIAFETDGLSVGIHVISFRIQDEVGIWSDPDYVTITIDPYPIATIVEISPNNTLEGQTVVFSGEGQLEYSIVSYEWSSSLDGLLSSERSFDISNLSNGTHTISFRVLNEYGFWSATVTSDISINGIPSIRIGTIFPATPELGNIIEFNAIGDDDGEIVLYVWKSDIDGEFYNGSKEQIFVDNLSADTHVISLRVQDNKGAWSEDVELTLKIDDLKRDDEGGNYLWLFIILIACGFVVTFLWYQDDGAGSRKSDEKSVSSDQRRFLEGFSKLVIDYLDRVRKHDDEEENYTDIPQKQDGYLEMDLIPEDDNSEKDQIIEDDNSEMDLIPEDDDIEKDQIIEDDNSEMDLIPEDDNSEKDQIIEDDNSEMDLIPEDDNSEKDQIIEDDNIEMDQIIEDDNSEMNLIPENDDIEKDQIQDDDGNGRLDEPPRTGINACPQCDTDLNYIHPVQEWYCPHCKRFVEPGTDEP